MRGLGAVVEEALEDLERVVAPAELDEERRRLGRTRRRRRRCPSTRESASARRRCGSGFVGSSVDDLAEDVDAPRRRAAGAERRVATSSSAASASLVEPELLIELGELRRDVRVAVLEVRDVLRDDLADLLVDRDRLEREALLRVEACRRARRWRSPRRRPPSSDWRSPIFSSVRASFGSLVDELLVLEDRLVVLLLLDELLGGLEYLVAINRHGRRHSLSTAQNEAIPSAGARRSGHERLLEQHAGNGQEGGGKKSPHKDTSCTARLHTSSSDFRLSREGADGLGRTDHVVQARSPTSTAVSLRVEPMQVHVVAQARASTRDAPNTKLARNAGTATRR